ncbi:hypothetical protein HYX16_03505 [Candidatus Woesearchaeota archaeon]|nr:hypothetical protein [Candidatus Woesearchaeota archaeon]
MESKEDSRVLVVKREILFADDAYFTGFRGVNTDPDFEKRIEENYEFIRRGSIGNCGAEENPKYKQIIPFMFLTRKKDKTIFTSRYFGAEERLTGMLTIGVMGHIEEHDCQENPEGQRRFVKGSPIYEGALRELSEEVEIIGLKSDPILIPFGYINLDKLPVDLVHFGLVYGLLVDGLEVRAKDESLAGSRFMKTEELGDLLREDNPKLCTWTKVAFPYIKNFIEGH